MLNVFVSVANMFLNVCSLGTLKLISLYHERVTLNTIDSLTHRLHDRTEAYKAARQSEATIAREAQQAKAKLKQEKEDMSVQALQKIDLLEAKIKELESIPASDMHEITRLQSVIEDREKQIIERDARLLDYEDKMRRQSEEYSKVSKQAGIWERKYHDMIQKILSLAEAS
jgi:chromosome segregation ATPase